MEATLGNRFGVIYILKYQYRSFEKLRIEWEFPEEVKGKKVISYGSSHYTFKKTHSSYTFDTEDELVKGTWQLRLYHKNKLLLIKDFIVI
ncbi:MAG: DUF3859 domain-containing protein [Salinivirgaceae bacterium]|nr:DUF3859 domain-containing protein [Salinivirgaceae bacterium]